MEPAAHLEVLAERARALVAATAGATGVLVPTCPGWTVAELLVHVGTVWGWAAEVVATGLRADRREPPSLHSDEGLRAWAQGEADRLVATLGAADPDAPCWTFGAPRAMRFWFRRQALETALHAWDVEHAVGIPAVLDPTVAADGVDEHLTVIVPRSVRAHPDGWSGETVHLHRTDGDGEWVVRLGPDGAVATERAHAKADLALRGPAESLWLWCANRAPADALGLERFGDEAVAARWQKEMAF
ncbi:MAG: maleylpyruvate isomerase family mycothiol-dependent enzyme [Actinomycetota bacterium]|jgi:uncharacterized protein (TIGR03083 family)|nr:maleylpyruvate isomerase family mycothiol-dependent enzyme [Actinomycetota bacterium]